jgi:hypothetical protein
MRTGCLYRVIHGILDAEVMIYTIHERQGYRYEI